MNKELGTIPKWHHCNYWTSKYVCILLEKRKITRYTLFPWWYLLSFMQISHVRVSSGNLWIFKLVWVR